MQMETVAIIMVFVFGTVFGILGWLLANRDAARKEAIDDLYSKTQKLTDKNTELQLLIASNHYQKSEIDNLFSMMRGALMDGFREVKDAIEKMRGAIDHIKSGGKP